MRPAAEDLRVKLGQTIFSIVLVFVLMLARAQADDERVIVLKPSFEYWTPEMRELHVRLPLQALGVGGEERFSPGKVFIDGRPARYAFWYFDGTLFAYGAFQEASKRYIEVFVPLPWRAGEQYAIRLTYTYAGQGAEKIVTVQAPARGGVWAESDGGNLAFLVREEAGIARRDEPVEFDVTGRRDVWPQPETNLRATVMTAPGVFEEIPCQVHSVEAPGTTGQYVRAPLVRFRTAVQLTLGPRGEAIVVLWHCPRPRAQEGEPPIRMEGSAPGGTVENSHYRITLDPRCGLLQVWHDKPTGVDFHYLEKRGDPPFEFAMNYTPDVYRVGQPWSHAMDWREPNAQTLRGPVFCETSVWAPMPNVPEIQARVTYRFHAHRPEVRLSSVIRVIEDVDVLGFRNGAMIQEPSLYTHAAWPRQDGSVVRVPIGQCAGNDTGAPPPGRMPADTPWVAFYHKDKGYGLALVTVKLGYFHEGPHHPSASNMLRYVSLYGPFLYTIRAMNLTYCANIRSYPTPLRAGTVAYEEAAFLAFTFQGEDEAQFEPLDALRREMLNPLVVVP